MDDMRLMENCAMLVKPISALARDFEKQLVEIDAGIHGEVSQMMIGEGFRNEVKKNSKGQSYKHTHAPLV